MQSIIPYTLLFLLLINCYACQEATPTTTTASPVETTVELPRLFMKTLTRNLRVRQTPDLEGSVLQILSQDRVVEYLHDSTSFTTTITYKRKDYNRSWYKVLTEEKTEGWIYSAFVEFLPEAENQQMVNKRETAELLEAANSKNADDNKTLEKERKQTIKEDLVNKYTSYMNGLDKQNPASVGLAMDRFESWFIGNNAKTCDAGYVAFHQFYGQVLGRLNRKNLSAYQHLKPELKRYHKATMTTDKYTRLLTENGFNFGLSNGQVVVAEDVDFILRLFFRECSTPMRGYMNQYQLEVPNFWLDQDQLLIDPKTLARWVLSWNYLVATYPEFIWHQDAKKRLERQLTILLQGTKQTAAFNNDSYILEDSYKTAYLHITENYPDSKIGKAFQEYLDVLEDNDWQASSAVTNAQNKIMNTFVL